MRKDFQIVCDLDDAARTDDAAIKIRKELSPVLKPVIYILYLMFESYDFDAARCSIGLRWIRGLTELIPDSRLIEEFHCYVRQIVRNKKTP